MIPIPWEDTLLAHHTFASHLPQRLDWVVSEYCDSAPWKCEHGRRGGLGAAEEKGAAISDMGAAELAKYNAADCRLTALSWARMQDDLAPEAAVYAHDKQLAAICRDMVRVGIGVDWERKEYLSLLMKRRAAALKGQMRTLLGKPDFSPTKLNDVRAALFDTLGASVVALTGSGLASTSNATLESLKAAAGDAGKFATLLLNYRSVTKARGTYVGGTREHPLAFDEKTFGKDGRARYNWKPFGTVSGRLACRLQSCPRWDPKDVAARAREMYIPRKGCQFVYWDVSQAEMRLAAYLSGDTAFIAACSGDVHANNAKQVWPDIAAKGWLDGDAKKDPLRGKPYRDIAKSFGFAICYGAEAEKLFIYLQSQGLPIPFRAVELILARLRAAYRTYYRWVDANVARVRQCGYMRTPIVGRIRWLGWFPKPTDIANYPVQGGLADIMNLRTVEICDKLPAGANMVAQVHDAGILEVPHRLVGAVERLIKDAWAPPLQLAGGECGLPIEQKRGERWSDL
jgi:DNA polymerase I-like protein with 3'-5' exonuclease and polymerase domains